jgi:nucleoside-diphosphate-sugar epimerase
MRILLTGATGFIGSHLLKKLMMINVPVAILVRKKSDNWRILEMQKEVHVIQGELENIASITGPIINFKPDTLVHLAWYGVENRFRNDYQQVSLNLTHVANLLQLAEEACIKKIIAFGSQGEYGPQNIPIDEKVIPRPTTLYSAAKLSAFHLFNVFCKQQSIDFSWIRLFSIYGPKDNGSWLIPTVIKQLFLKREPALTAGTQKWDFLYIDDAVDAIIKILQTENTNGIFNLGSGRSLAIREIVEKIRDNIDPALELGFGLIPYREDQVMFLEANIEKLKTLANWMPQIGLDEGLQKTIAWYKQT